MDTLQAIRPPNDFRLSFLPSLALNLSRDEVIQPHGPELAKTRHIKFGTFNTHSVRFSVFLFFPNAAPDSTSATRNALSLERQKDLYDHIIIPAAYEAVSEPCRQEIPRTYDMAYAKSRSFQEKPGNNRWKPDDISRAVHLQYTIPAEDLSLFWNLVAEKANSFQLTTKSGELVSYLKDPRLLFQSHDLKNTFGKGTLSESLNSFECSVLRAFDPAHLDVHSCWIDIGARDYVASVPPHDISGRRRFTVLWKSQCHSYLHEQLSKIAPRSHLNAVDFQWFLLRDIGDYQAKAKRTRASNPGHPHERKPGVIRAKAYSCHKELFSVMFSDYDLFGSGFLPLLALDEGMINDLSSATGNQGRHQAPNTTQVLLKASEANKRHLRATSDARALANYGIRKEMTFRLDVIVRMWHRGYFESNQSPHVGHRTFNSDPTKDVAIDRRPRAGYQRATFFRIQFWAPYFSPPECTALVPWGSVDDHQHRHPCIPPTVMSRAINVTEFQSHSNNFMQLWRRLISHHNQLREAEIRERNQICKQAMECLADLVGPQCSHENNLAFIMPWKFCNSTAGDGQREDLFRLHILVKPTRFSTRLNQPTILLPSRHNVMTLVNAIESLPQLDQTILRRANGSARCSIIMASSMICAVTLKQSKESWMMWLCPIRYSGNS
ncbi:hypothetical protein HZ326_30164 [Fusarium oxysporum f. sp. albedinis]|nr:hypothetical protein HZ326_30164 [Fusarium oxysporum f. sp. albedinis]